MDKKTSFFVDILRDKNSKKYSLTKLSGFIALIIFVLTCLVSLYLMYESNKIDYIFIGEIIGFTLVTLGFKNLKKQEDISPQKQSYDYHDDNLSEKG